MHVQKTAMQSKEMGLDDGSDVEIDDGFKIPARVWSRLHRFEIFMF